VGISWLEKGYDSFDKIDLGDKTYTRSNSKYKKWVKYSLNMTFDDIYEDNMM